MTKHTSKPQASDKEVYKMIPHGPLIMAGGKMFCFSCGHVLLNNVVSRWATEKGCMYDIHPSYKRMMKKAGGQNNGQQ